MDQLTTHRHNERHHGYTYMHGCKRIYTGANAHNVFVFIELDVAEGPLSLFLPFPPILSAHETTLSCGVHQHAVRRALRKRAQRSP